MALKADLTPEEAIKVGYLYNIMGVEQHALSIAFSVNMGRISEAAQAMAYASENYREIYKTFVAGRTLQPNLLTTE